MNGGNISADASDVVEEDAVLGSNILDYDSIPTPAYTGYTLSGWAYDAGGTSVVGALDNVTEDDTIYAIWVPTQYDITYDLDGGTNSAANPAVYDIETATITLGDAVKDAKTFAGWFTEAEFTNEVTEIALGSSGDVDLFAEFTD